MTKAIIFTRGKAWHSYKQEEAFAEGLARQGVLTSWADRNARPEPDSFDLAVVWGVRNKALINWLNSHNIDFVVLERGYVGDRHEWTSCGFNGLNGRADFCNEGVSDKRSRMFKSYLQPQQIRDSKKLAQPVVIMGQIKEDASVINIGFDLWLDNTYRVAQQMTSRKILYRPHPLDKNPFIPDGLEVAHGDLHDVIKNAWCVVTLNSNSGVDTVLAGVPCVTMDKGAMAWGVTDHHLSAIIQPETHDRKQWFNELAYCQWSLDEMKSGEAWQHLKRKMI